MVFSEKKRLFSKTTMPPAEFYAKHISPYKGELELWYQKHLSFYTDCMLVFLTAWVILKPESDLVYRIFKYLPEKPIELI